MRTETSRERLPIPSLPLCRRTPEERSAPARARSIALLLLAAGAVAGVLAGDPVQAEVCQPGPWQECLQLELECAQCGEPCYYADSGPCWEALACENGYYVHARWTEDKGVNCKNKHRYACYLFQTYTQFSVDEVHHETWERRECYQGTGNLFEVMTGYTTSYPGTVWRKGGGCSLVDPRPSPVIQGCI